MKSCIDCGNEYPLSYFYKNKGMKDGHLNSCKSCRRKFDNKYKEENKKALYRQTAQWKQENKEDLANYRKKYYSENSEREKELVKKWKALNRARSSLISSISSGKRRATKRNATPSWSDLEAIKFIYAEARRLTLLTGIQYHVDHIVPLIHPLIQGLHVPANLRIVPYYENCSKGNKLIEDIVYS